MIFIYGKGTTLSTARMLREHNSTLIKFDLYLSRRFDEQRNYEGDDDDS